jgi:hypothetical protein
LELPSSINKLLYLSQTIEYPFHSSFCPSDSLKFKVICLFSSTKDQKITLNLRQIMSPSTISLLDAIKGRSSLHTLSDDVDIPDSRVQEIVREGILHSPTPFNCQSGRAVVLVKAEHKKFWDLAHDSAKSKVPEAVFEKVFAPRIKMFRAAYGTVSLTKALNRRLFLTCLCVQILFYESGNAMQAVCDRMPIVKDKMPQCKYPR